MRSVCKLIGVSGVIMAFGACGGTLQTQGETVGTGATAPPFVLADFSGRPVSLESLTQEGPAVVIFYRGHW